jgi:UDP-N-acetylglucosamine acyltransferase
MARVHAAAMVDARAEVAADVDIGPYAVVEGGVVLGAGCVLHAHAVVRGRSTLGPGNVVHPFSVIGGEPQMKRVAAGPAHLQIGAHNVFREHVTIHGGSGEGVTVVGSDNLFMVGAHVAHDVRVGSGVVLANATQLAGHVVVEDWATFGGLSGVAQHVRVGESAFVAAAAACERDVPPFMVVQGDRARVRGVNVVGLRRRGVPEESVVALGRAARVLWRSGTPRVQALRELERETDPYVVRLLEALSRLPAKR